MVKSKAVVFTLFIISLALILPCRALAGGPLGLGIVFGDPTGLSGKYWIDGRTSFDGVLGVGFNRHGHFTICVDWTHHWADLTPVQEGRFLLGVGVGPIISLGSRPDVGMRFKGLADYQFDEAPIGVFLELAPGVTILDPGLEIMGGIGVRWYFMH